MLVNCLSGVALRPWLKDLVRKMTEKDRARIKKHKKETKKPMVIKRINKKGKVSVYPVRIWKLDFSTGVMCNLDSVWFSGNFYTKGYAYWKSNAFTYV